MLAAWAAAPASERASVTLAPLVPDRTTTPHAADTGHENGPLLADRIAGNDQRLAAGREPAGRVDPDLGY